MKPLIINAAITGMVPMRSDTPHVPITPQEIIADTRRCRDAGATILHLHAREADGTPTYKKEIYAEIFQGVREECPEVLISGSCSGRRFGEFWQRSAVLELEPDFGSLTLGSLNFPKQPSVNSPDMIRKLALAMKSRGIVPELEIFDLEMADYAHYLIRKDFLEPPLYANLLLRSLGTMAATPDHLCRLVRALPAGTTWSVLRDTNWIAAHGACLAAVGHLLSRRIGTLVVSSSVQRTDPHPWGTHWKLDPLRSTSRLTCVHFGETHTRTEKLPEIAHEPLVRRFLRPCWENLAGRQNCAECEKCLRTQTILLSCGKLMEYPVFRHHLPLAERIDRLHRISSAYLFPVYEGCLRAGRP